MAKKEIAAVFRPGMHASTFGGNSIACRAGLAAIEIIEEDGLLERGIAIGERFRDRFEAIAAAARPGSRDSRSSGDDRPGPDDRRDRDRLGMPETAVAGERHARDRRPPVAGVDDPQRRNRRGVRHFGRRLANSPEARRSGV